LKGLRGTAIAVVSALFGLAIWSFGPWLAAICGLVGMVGITIAVREIIAGRSDPYSLASLEEFERKEEVRRLLDSEEQIASGADVVCPRCFDHVPSGLPACPRCGHTVR